jgi:8-oxo-dGTP pyrophosphatase MutT (NUDIX family)
MIHPALLVKYLVKNFFSCYKNNIIPMSADGVRKAHKGISRRYGCTSSFTGGVQRIMCEGSKKTKTPVPASTVILIREESGIFQVYLVKRSGTSGFMPGNYVFPGGKVDAGDRDTDFWIEKADLGREEIRKRFGGKLDLDEIMAHCVSAVRETFEEVGLLLMQAPEGYPLVPEDLEAARMAGKLKRQWLRDLLRNRDWKLALSRLFPWSHWITPEAMPVRYDTRFFIAITQPDQACMPDRNEIIQDLWAAPEEALRMNQAGHISLSPPTLASLQELLGYAPAKGAGRGWSRRSWGAVNMPKLVPCGDGLLIVLPWDPFYEDINGGENGREEEDVVWLDPGKAFSRLLYREGLWKPVKMGPEMVQEEE